MIILLAVLLLTAIIAAYLLGRYRKRMDLMASELDELKRNLNIFNDGAQGIGRRLVEAEKQLKMVASDQAQLKQQGGTQSYTDAANMVAQGLTVDEIVDRCDLSRAEVELMILLSDRGN
jgi:hypothetical protein